MTLLSENVKLFKQESKNLYFVIIKQLLEKGKE